MMTMVPTLSVLLNSERLPATKVKQNFHLNSNLLLGLIFVDTEYNVYSALGCKAKGDSVWKSLSNSVFGKSSKFLTSSNLEGNLDQQGGAFVIDKDGTIVYRYIDSHAGEYKDHDNVVKALKKLKEK